MNVLEANLELVERRIADATAAAGRAPGSVALLAVTKTQSLAAVTAARRAGLVRFGTNYVQEGVTQIAAAPDAEWHFIGRLQTNKTRAVAENFSWVHSADRDAIVRRLAAQRPRSLDPLNVLLQIDVDDEPSKGGLPAAAVPDLAALVASEPRLRLRGLMAIPRPTDDAVAQRHAFAAVRAAFDALRAVHAGVDTLSMGMSGDLESAIHEGATMVRIGTALFGARG